MTGIYGINYSNNYSLTGNYGYAYSTGAVSSAQPEEKGMVVNPGKSDVEKPGRKSSPAECETCKNRNIRMVPTKWSPSNLHLIFHHRLPPPEFVPTNRSM